MFTNALNEQFGEILKRVSPAERRKFSRKVAIALRAHRSDEILANRNADGTPMTPRKPQRRRKNKNMKMFQKLGRRSSMRVRANAGYASVRFQPKNHKIAENHQFGKRVQVNEHARVKYPERTLLGMDKQEEKIVFDHLYELISEAF